MSIFRFLLFLFLLTGLQPGGVLFAQDESALTDSLRLLISTSAEDTNKVNLMNDLAWELKVDLADQARKTLQQSAALAARLNYPKGEAQAFNNLGVVETIHEQYESAKEHYQKALELRKQLNDKEGMASLYNNIGNLEDELGNYESAIKYLRQSLQIGKELKDSLRIARTSNNIAVVFETRGFYPEALDNAFTYLTYSEFLGDNPEIARAHNLIGNIKSELERFEEAREHYQQSLEIQQQLNDPLELATVHNNIGNNKDDTGERYIENKQYTLAYEAYQEALKDYRKALTIYEQQNDQQGIGGAYNNIGLVFKNLGTYYLEQDQPVQAAKTFDEAIDYLNRSLNIRRENSNDKGMMEVYNGIGDVRRRQKNFKEALNYTEAYLAIAKRVDDRKFMQKGFKDLSRVYADLGNYGKAYEYRKLYDETRYERLDEEQVKENFRREAIYGDFKNQIELERQLNANEQQQARLREATLQRRSLLLGLLGLLILAALLFNRNRLKNKANKELEDKNKIIQREQERSDELLLNILPEKTAKELKENKKAAAQSYRSVTVLFTDFKSFTQATEQMSPDELVAELDKCFRAFDEISTKYGIEKIKTIGDSYMCAGGLPEANTTHPIDAVRAALEIREFMNTFNLERARAGRPVFETRIGLHTGPVIAGIVGSKKFAYDIWGDTVNTAARMESSGEIGKVNISQSTYNLVKEDFHCESRGKISAKNKGEIEMYFVDYN